MYLLAGSGKKLSGKDTIGNIIQKLLPKDVTFHRIGFADALYREVANMLRLVDRRFNCCTTEEVIEHLKLNKADYRGLLQWWGTEYRRKQDPDYWVKQLAKSILKLEGEKRFVYVNDCRFLNEANFILQAGASIWRVVRWQEGEPDLHPSETELDSFGFDVILPNNGTLAELEELVSCHLHHLIKTK